MIPLPPELERLTSGRAWHENHVGEAGARVFRIEGLGYLKFGTDRIAVDISAEQARLDWLQGRVPCPAILHYEADATRAWLLTSEMPGRMTEEVLDADPDLAPRLAVELAAFLRRLHALPVGDCPFDATHPERLSAARQNIDAGLVDEDDFDPEREGWSAEQVWDALQAELPARFERVVTHGDFSLGNIFVDDDLRVTGIIDLGRLGVADPYQDLAILWNCLEDYGHGAALFAAYGVAEPDESRLRFHLMLDELF